MSADNTPDALPGHDPIFSRDSNGISKLTLIRYEDFTLFLKSSVSPVVKTTSETKQSVRTLASDFKR